MIIQCEECKTRFRLADEKLKTTGTKVRCSKCKHVFTVMPPAPEPVDEGIDFDAMNMEEVSGQAASAEQSTTEQSTTEQAAQEEAAVDQEAESDQDSENTSDLDFSSLEQEMTSKETPGDELAEEFSFVGIEPSGEFPSAPDDGPIQDDGGLETETSEEAADFAFEDPPETGRPTSREIGSGDTSFEDEGPAEAFDFDTPASASETSSEQDSEPEAFSFDEPDDVETAEDDVADSSAFSFDDPDDAAAGSFGDETPVPATDDEFGMGDRIETFSFDDDEDGEWKDDAESGDTGFDFDAPAFDSEAPSDTAEETSGESPQFGEINFASDSEEEAPTYETENDFSAASFPSEESSWEETSGRSAQYQEKDASKNTDDEILPVPPTRRKSPLSRILSLLILLLLVLGGAAGYFYMQDGSLDVNRIIQRFTGETQPEAPENRIGINISGSSYVNNPSAGQLLIVQGEAVNNFPTARSAITVKGILLDAQGNTLFQQTVSCGNFLDEKTISKMPFDKIEEAMNNQFGDSLSNMNVAAGATIPFTIVFRNLPEGIANINVEVVGSKMGSS